MSKKEKKSKSILGKLFFFVLIFSILYFKFPQAVKKSARYALKLIDKFTSEEQYISWQPVADGIEISETNAKNEQNHLFVSMFLIRIDPLKFRIKVHYEREMTTAERIAAETGAICIVNGGFFDDNGKPLGFLVSNGKIFNPLPRNALQNSGIFYLKDNTPHIIHQSELTDTHLDEAIQSMPRLIDKYKPIKKISNDNTMKRRSGIAIDSKNRIIFAITDTQLLGLSLPDFQKFLLKPELQIKSALNLDGGRSSQLYFQYAGFQKFIHGMSEVPVFLTVIPMN